MGSLLAPLIVLSAAASFAPFVLEAFGLRAFVATYAIAAAAWLWLRRVPAALPAPAIVVIAALLRLAFIAQPAMLSTDVYRYLWDGRVFANGINPYAHAPDDQALAALRTPWHSSINHPEIPTIYPPHAEILFGALGLAGAGLISWRLLLLAADLALILLLIRHVPRRDVLAYATFPPLLIECSWSGHIEVIAALLLLLAWSSLAKSEARSATALAIAAGVKLIPIAAVPVMLIAASRRWRYVLIFAIVLILPAIAFVLAGPLMPGFHDYATRWIFN